MDKSFSPHFRLYLHLYSRPYKAEYIYIYIYREREREGEREREREA